MSAIHPFAGTLYIGNPHDHDEDPTEYKIKHNEKNPKNMEGEDDGDDDFADFDAVSPRTFAKNMATSRPDASNPKYVLLFQLDDNGDGTLEIMDMNQQSKMFIVQDGKPIAQ